MDFLKEQGLIFTGKKYEEIYILFNKKYDISYDQLFTLCATVGFKNNKLNDRGEKGREFRGNYLKTESRTSLYSIILNDADLGKSVDCFDDKEYQRKCVNKLEKYAEGGMQILVEKVFRKKWLSNKLDESYEEYILDIIEYVFEVADLCPF